MRWALVGIVLFLAVAGVLYGGGVTFVSSLSDAVASRGAHGPATVAATTGQAEAPTRPDRNPTADQISASETPQPEPSSAPQPAVASNPEDSSPSATQQRTFKSRKPLETIDAREFLRHRRQASQEGIEKR